MTQGPKSTGKSIVVARRSERGRRLVDRYIKGEITFEKLHAEEGSSSRKAWKKFASRTHALAKRFG